MNNAELEATFGVSTQQLDKWAAPFEQGEWPEGKTVILGRPRLANEELKTVTFKMPIGKVAALDGIAAQRGESRSDCLRALVEAALAGA